jgi:uncharacterized protein GlcG (DUF336 family)
MSLLKLSQAVSIIDAALAEGRKRSFSLLAVAVLDPGGHVIAFKREDGASFLRFELAGKQPAFINALAAVTQGRMVPSPGGVLVTGADGQVLGAVGISGDTGDNDEICALAGIAAAGLSAIPGAKAKPA